jgi:hypothetical protein
MGKKKSPSIRPDGRIEFRESDFAGMPPVDQAQLSGSLNHLSEQLAASRKMLLQIEAAPLPDAGDGALNADDTKPSV